MQLRKDLATGCMYRIGDLLPGGDVPVIGKGRLEGRAELVLLDPADLCDDEAVPSLRTRLVVGHGAVGGGAAELRESHAHSPHDEPVLELERTNLPRFE